LRRLRRGSASVCTTVSVPFEEGFDFFQCLIEVGADESLVEHSGEGVKRVGRDNDQDGTVRGEEPSCSVDAQVVAPLVVQFPEVDDQAVESWVVDVAEFLDLPFDVPGVVGPGRAVPVLAAEGDDAAGAPALLRVPGAA
jgi:hypothetical protein